MHFKARISTAFSLSLKFTKMNYNNIYQELSRNGIVFKELLLGISKEETFWKSNPKKWCLLEIICHLYDEEREDFRVRVKQVLETPQNSLPPIDPVSWVQDRHYIEQNYSEKLKGFIHEREQSVRWLQSLENSQWDNTYDHAVLGKMSAHLFLSNWLAHDYLHIRQIVELKFNYLKNISKESLDYAGNW